MLKLNLLFLCYNDSSFSPYHVISSIYVPTEIWQYEIFCSGFAYSCSGNLCADFDRWMEKLGIAAATGVKVVCRQTLYRSHYALIDGDFNPLPVRNSYVFQHLHLKEILAVLNRFKDDKTLLLQPAE